MKKLKVLVACEESQRVCEAFRKRGHEAYSCDILEPSGGHPEWAIQQNVLPLIDGNCEFMTLDGEKHMIGHWDIIVAHPPCTYLTVAANKLYNVERYGDKAVKRLADREAAIKFFKRFTVANCDYIAIENPIGVMSTRYRKPDQIIQPYMFGDPVRKATCLWLKGLPELKPTNVVEPNIIPCKGKKKNYTFSGPAWNVYDENGKALSYRDPRVSRARSKTYPGIAEAMAEQWGDFVSSERRV